MIDTLIKRKIQELPANTRYAIEHFDWVPTVRKIAEKYHLQLSDVDLLHREILLSILGLISPEEFYTSLSKKLPIPSEEVSLLLGDIQKEIALPLQKLEFSKETLRQLRKEQSDKKGVLSHDGVKNSLEEEGIILIDDSEEVPSPPRDSLLGSSPSQVTLENNSPKEEKEEVKQNEKAQSNEEHKKENRISYREEPTDEDYQGVHLHRVPGTDDFKKEEKLLSMKEERFFSPKKERIDISKKNDQEAFLKHIGAI